MRGGFGEARSRASTSHVLPRCYGPDVAHVSAAVNGSLVPNLKGA
jgi:hypothetical protein